MKNLKYTLAIAFSIAVSAVFAQKETPPRGGQPHDFKLPAKKERKLDNGMGVTAVQFGNIPKVTINLIVKTGNVHEGPEQIWLADLMADLLEEGSVTKNAKQVSKEIASMGGELSIGVGLNTMNISGNVLSEFAPDLVKLIADIIQHPGFPASELDRLKADMKRTLSVQLSRPQPIASKEFRALIYPDHPYGRIYPTEAMIDAYSVDDIKGFFDANVGAARSVLYVVGKFDDAAVQKAVEESFAGWRKGPDVFFPEAKAVTSKQISILDRPGAPQSTIMIGLPVIAPSDPDFLKLSITNALLGGSFASRITSNIREDKGYTYSPSSSITSGVGTSIWYEQADVTTEVTGPSLKEISYEVDRLQKEAPTAEELEGIQNYQAGVYVLQNSSPGGIIGQLSFLDLHNLPESYLTERVKNIYAVSPADIQEMTKKYLDYNSMTLVVVGDKKKIEEQIKKFEEEIKKF